MFSGRAFRNIDSYLLEASASLGCVGIKRFFRVVLNLSMPTILAASLLVFMQAFADFGTPILIGEGYRTFPVEIYNQYLGEVGTDYNFASAISVIAIIMTALVFFLQKYATSKYNFSMNATRPVEKKKAKGIRGALMYLYCYGILAIAFMPQIYVSYLSFRNSDSVVFLEGYSLASYRMAVDKLLFRSIKNTLVLGFGALAIIIVFSVLIAYLVVRRPSWINNVIDTLSMLPYIMPGAIIGIALVVAFGQPPLVLSGTMAIMIISFVLRRIPYSIRSTNTILMQIPISVEEAAISLGASSSNLRGDNRADDGQWNHQRHSQLGGDRHRAFKLDHPVQQQEHHAHDVHVCRDLQRKLWSGLCFQRDPDALYDGFAASVFSDQQNRRYSTVT